MASESASTDQHIELLTEHFGFNPKGFIDKLVYAANEHLYFLAETFEHTLLEALRQPTPHSDDKVSLLLWHLVR